MIQRTRGIALHTVKFSETSIIAKVYTEQFGLQSFIIKGARKKGSKIRPGLFQPLTLLELTLYHREKNSLHTLKEAGIIHPYQTLHSDIRKSSIALFLAEVIYKSICEEESNPGLFGFLFETCMKLDGLQGTFPVFHLVFLARLTKFLGFQPENNFSGRMKYFNLLEGKFQPELSDIPYELNESNSRLFSEILSASYDTLEDFRIPAQVRNILLEKILQYYQLHHSGFREIKSHLVLHSVLG
jgi:DNA repair protein RecO (recombination protein O)